MHRETAGAALAGGCGRCGFGKRRPRSREENLRGPDELVGVMVDGDHGGHDRYDRYLNRAIDAREAKGRREHEECGSRTNAIGGSEGGETMLIRNMATCDRQSDIVSLG